MNAADLGPAIFGALLGAASTGALTFLTIYQRLARLEERVQLIIDGKLQLS